MTDTQISKAEISRTLTRRNPELVEREREACYLRVIEGLTYDEIANRLGLYDRSAARRDASRGYVALMVRNPEEVDMHLAEIREDMEWNRELRDNPPQKMIPGRGPALDSSGDPVLDMTEAGQASERMRKLRDQYLNLRGLYPPKRTVNATLDLTELDSRIEQRATRLQAHLGISEAKVIESVEDE